MRNPLSGKAELATLCEKKDQKCSCNYCGQAVKPRSDTKLILYNIISSHFFKNYDNFSSAFRLFEYIQ